MIDLKAQFGKSYRVVKPSWATGEPGADQAWLWEIPGRHGHVGLWGPDTLSAFTAGRYRRGMLLAVPGANAVQVGDSELTVTFPIEQFEPVARILGLRKRRRLSPERQAAGAARLAAWRNAKLAATHDERHATIDPSDVESISPA